MTTKKPVKKAAAATKATSIARTPARVRERKPNVTTNESVIDRLMDAIMGGMSLIRACTLPGMPNRTAFLKLVAADTGLRTRYEDACQARADFLAEQTIDISDDGTNDSYLDEEGNRRTDLDVIARSKLRVAARQWYIAKVAPKKYGDKVDVNHGGQEDNPIQQTTRVVVVPAKQVAVTGTKTITKADE